LTIVFSTVILLILGSALALVIAEGFLRLFANWKPRTIDAGAYRLSDEPDLGFEFVPANRFCHYYWPPLVGGRPWKQCYRINSLGIRDREYPPYPPPGTRRIVCVGDSSTFGEGVEAEQAFPKRLEALLWADTVRNSGNRVEVINAGVAGYDIEKKLAHFRLKCLGLHSQIAILAFTLNDPQVMRALYIDGDGFLASREAPRWRRFRQRVKKRSALGNWGAHRWSELAGAQRLMSTYGSRSPEWIRTRNILREFRNLSLENSVHLLVAILPAPFRLNGGHPYLPIYRIIESFLEEEGIAWVNLFESLRGMEKPRVILESCDFHPSSEAHARFASALHRELAGKMPFRDVLNPSFSSRMR
jgi:hypothetical protein